MASDMGKSKNVVVVVLDAADDTFDETKLSTLRSVDLEKQTTSKRYHSISSKISYDYPGPPPDGGRQAWMQVIAGNLVSVITWGLISSYGVFQTFYQTYLENSSDSDISWIGTLQIFSLLLVGTFAGRASDAGYSHELAYLGTSMIVFGLFMTSFATQYYQLLLAQGVCVGLGMGILYMPSLSVAASYFQKRKPLAVSIISTGGSIGGLIYPAMAQQLLPKLGFAWTMRCMAAVTAIMAIAISMLLRARVPPRKTGPIVDWKAFTEIPYVFFCMGFFLIYWTVYIPFYFIDKYGYQFGNFTPNDSISLLLVTNAFGILGRLLPGIIASRWLGPLNTAVPTAAVVAVVILSWTAVHTQNGLWVFAAVYGLFGSGVQALFAMSLAALTEDLSQLGVRMGMVFSVIAFAALTGNPLAGAIMVESKGSFLGAQIWAGTGMLLGAVCLTVARIASTGLVLRIKK